MNRPGIVKAVAAAAVVISMAAAGTALYTAMEAQMDVQDALTSRLYQVVDAKAAVQAAAGQGATASVNGNDAVGQVNITTGKNPQAGSLIHVTFATPYQTQPFVMVAPEDQPPPPEWYVTVDTNGFDIWVGTAPKADTNYPFAYFVAARPWLMYLETPTAAPQD